MTITDRSFANMFARTRAALGSYAHEVHTERWQGVDIAKRPEMNSYELLGWTCHLSLDWLTQLHGDGAWSQGVLLEELGKIVEPSLPWADDHFLERVSGEPLNPGVEWANWPWATSADKFRKDDRFNHSYMERLWPKFANFTVGGKVGSGLPDQLRGGYGYFRPHFGIRGVFGDLQDLVELIANEPDTRQAWIPLFFPEDTGKGDGGRKPCTLGYQIIMRNNELSIYYPLRSCDFVRHFRDDIYMAIRLLLWVLDRCREINPEVWDHVHPGYYMMHCTSLHIFENDYRQLFGASSK